MTWNAEVHRQHTAVYRAFGQAVDYHCIDCDKPADEWSRERDGNPDDVNCYWPRCYSCHKTYDSRVNTPEAKRNMSEAAKRRWAKIYAN